MGVLDTDLVEVWRDGVTYKATRKQLNSVTGELELKKSLRFRNQVANTSESVSYGAFKAYLSRTPIASGNRKTWTFSVWLKLGKEDSRSGFMYTVFDANDNLIRHNKNKKFELMINGVGSVFGSTQNNTAQRKYWNNLVVAYDSTQAVESDRVKIYYNGVEETTSGTYPPLNHEGHINSNTLHNIGRRISGDTEGLDGYMTAITFVDGEALAPEKFGKIPNVPPRNGPLWYPREPLLDVGPNGFYLNFEDSSSLETIGKDTSGNGNNFTNGTTSEINVYASDERYDVMYDVPTPTDERSGNYPLMYAGSYGANLTRQGPVGWNTHPGFPLPLTGKWYAECLIVQDAYDTGTDTGNTPNNNSGIFGIIPYPFVDVLGYSLAGATYMFMADNNNPRRGVYSGTVDNGNAEKVTTVDGYGTGSIASFAYDADEKTVQFYRDNIPFGPKITGVHNNNDGTSTFGYVAFGLPNGMQNRDFDNWDNSMIASHKGIHHINYGQQPFAYTPPEGFKACNSFQQQKHEPLIKEKLNKLKQRVK